MITMDFRKIILKIYIKNKKKPIAIAQLNSESQVNDFFKELNDQNLKFIKFGQIGLNKTEFRYAEIIYKK